MNKFNLKEFDYKAFLLQKGERLALWAMVGVMVLLIVFGVFVNGLSRGTASANADAISKLQAEGQRAISNSKPTPGELIPDPTYMKAAVLARIDPEAISCYHAFFTNLPSEDRKWRKPEVLKPDEFQVALIRDGVKTYLFTTHDGKQAIMYLFPKDTKDAPKGGMMPGMNQRGPNMNTNVLNSGGRGMPAMAARWGMPSAAVVGDDTGRNVDMRAIQTDALENPELTKGGHAAQTIVPMRIAVVYAAFPYKAQFELFQRALRYKSIEEMEQNAAVEFLGLNVQRREVGSGGKTTAWKDLDVITPLRPFLAYGVEPEDPLMKSYGVIWEKDRLLIPRPFLARSDYPRPDLPSLDKTLKTIEEATKSASPPPLVKQNSKFKGDTDIYELDVGNANGQKPGPGGVPPPVRPMPPTKGPMGAPGAPIAAFGSQERLLPEKCLVRFIDVTLEPGKTYEYQIQVKMANPLFEKKDAAISQELTKDKEMVGAWAVVPKKLTVPSEGDYYVYDDPKIRHSYNPDRLWTQIHRWFDWVPINPAAPRESLTAVGEWSIAEQTSAARGEYIGHWEDVEIPVWNPKQESFVLAQHPDVVRRRRLPPGVKLPMHKGVDVDFSTGSVLIDFNGGKAEMKGLRDPKTNKELPSVRDEGGVDALILTPDGRLIVRNSRQDTNNAEREQRVKTWSEWVKAVRERSKEAKTGKVGGDGFFDDKKP